MKTLTALLLWLVSSVGGAGPACDLGLVDEPALCIAEAAPPPPEEDGDVADESLQDLLERGTRQHADNGSRISNGF